MTTPQDIANQFVQFYYNTFDTNRAALGSLYRESSSLTWEGRTFSATNNIVEHFTSLPFEKVAHQVTTLDAQAASPASLIVMVTGALAIDGAPPMQYSQCFHLLQDGGSFYVFNDLFRLNLSG
ncbi:hypothetical protein M407DRAFT_244800 [Tulasnella calospora MUT 4182]|uniref:Nuclear transport factor 2 n=1 Tax=Tulasnella calospora MUT 4182 TaxID=1051891 RepID=A0A0C3QD06_9AGAM|nr:hypothetical protein M407DRAFT_244800 [Tulasnella calospora MUT 4182]